jgi:hypothetical protein
MSEQQVLEASEIGFTPCDICKTTNRWLVKQHHYRNGELTHSDVVCSVCRSPAVIFND